MQNKFTIRTLAALAVAAFAALPLSAAASDGTITFAGSVTGTTCTVSVNGGAATNAVQLPSVAAIQLATKGAVSGKTNVVISLSQCQGSATQARAFFEAGPNVDSTTFNWRISTDRFVALSAKKLAASPDIFDVGKAVVVLVRSFSERRSTDA